MARGGEQPGELWDTLQDALMGALGPEQSPALLSAGIQRAPLAGDCLVPPWSCASRSCDEAPAKGARLGVCPAPGSHLQCCVARHPPSGHPVLFAQPTRNSSHALFTEIKGLRGCSSPFRRSSHTLETSGAP